MKSYEILPAGMTGSAIGGGCGAKGPKPYEILPGAGIAAQGLGGKSGGCGCGGSCGGEKPSSYSSATGIDIATGFKAAPAKDRSVDLDSLFESISRLGPGGGGSGPGASLCGSIQRRIEWLRSEIARLLEQFGPRGPAIAAAWRLARQICSAPDAPSLCARLVEQQVAVGSRIRAGSQGDVDAYNAAWGAALDCSNSESGMALAGRRFFGCWAAITAAQRLERIAEGEMKRV